MEKDESLYIECKISNLSMNTFNSINENSLGVYSTQHIHSPLQLYYPFLRMKVVT